MALPTVATDLGCLSCFLQLLEGWRCLHTAEHPDLPGQLGKRSLTLVEQHSVAIKLPLPGFPLELTSFPTLILKCQHVKRSRFHGSHVKSDRRRVNSGRDSLAKHPFPNFSRNFLNLEKKIPPKPKKQTNNTQQLFSASPIRTPTASRMFSIAVYTKQNNKITVFFSSETQRRKLYVTEVDG